MLNKESSPRHATSRANFWIPCTFSFSHQTVPRGYGALEEASVITKQKAIIFWIQGFCKISSSERARIIPRRSIISTQSWPDKESTGLQNYSTGSTTIKQKVEKAGKINTEAEQT